MKFIAQITNPALTGPLGNPSKTGATEAGSLISILITSGFIIGVLGFVTYFIWGAIRWIISKGDKSETTQAREHVTQALVGLVILLCLFIILGIFNTIFKLDLLNLTLPTPTGSSPVIRRGPAVGGPRFGP